MVERYIQPNLACHHPLAFEADENDAEELCYQGYYVHSSATTKTAAWPLVGSRWAIKARMVFNDRFVRIALPSQSSVTENYVWEPLADSLRSAAFVPGAPLYLVPAFHFHVGRPSSTAQGMDFQKFIGMTT
jgi:hypothetical protein